MISLSRLRHPHFKMFPQSHTSFVTLSLVIIVFALFIIHLAAQSLTLYYVKDAHVLDAHVTAYSSEVGQTDSTPFLTASNKKVRSGIIANNCLPFGARVALAGEVYVVEDRMNKRYGCEVFDIWMEDTEEAIQWGVKKLKVVILK